MIKIIEFLFRVAVLATFGTVVVLGLIICAALLWKSKYMELANDVKNILIYGEKRH
jgi:hypothetical protein